MVDRKICVVTKFLHSGLINLRVNGYFGKMWEFMEGADPIPNISVNPPLWCQLLPQVRLFPNSIATT
jgi:hypothetical protein